jgi:hypothetical protein
MTGAPSRAGPRATVALPAASETESLGGQALGGWSRPRHVSSQARHLTEVDHLPRLRWFSRGSQQAKTAKH